MTKRKVWLLLLVSSLHFISAFVNTPLLYTGRFYRAFSNSYNVPSSCKTQRKYKPFELFAITKKPQVYNEGGEEFYALEYDLSKEDDDEPALGSKRPRNDREWMFFDVAKINVKGGDGGDGCSAFRREFRIHHGGPSGGNGGNGGNVYFECDKNLNTLGLLHRQVHYKGKDGTNGRGDSRHGQQGSHCLIRVPPGTIIRDQDGRLAGELNRHGERMVVAKGGRGGRGNEYFKTPKVTTPCIAEKGEPGITRWLNIELKLLADVGLIGIPNAGKSTLLAAVSNAKPKIADYPFTTVVPNLGVCNLFSTSSSSSSLPSLPSSDTDNTTATTTRGGSSGSMVIADIPGLLEGAHAGVGLGLAFLRHIQRCRVLVHVLNGCSEDLLGDYLAINQELSLFHPGMVQKPQVIVINKIDVPEVRERVSDYHKQLSLLANHTRILPISAITHENTQELMYRVSQMLSRIPYQTSEELFSKEEKRVDFLALDEAAYEPDNPATVGQFDILCDVFYPGQYRVVGSRIERIVKMTNWEYYGARERFHRILEAQGILDRLHSMGAKQGDLIMIGDFDFEYWDKEHQWIGDLDIEE